MITVVIKLSASFSLLFMIASAHAATSPPPLTVFQVRAQASHLIGTQIRVEGYIVNLNSHGWVLATKPSCKRESQIGLRVERVEDTAAWKKAFRDSWGPKRAVLIGVLRWVNPVYPELTIQRVQNISSREAAIPTCRSTH